MMVAEVSDGTPSLHQTTDAVVPKRNKIQEYSGLRIATIDSFIYAHF
jgi:hypothetical protein